MNLAIGILFVLAERSGRLIFPQAKCHKSQSYYRENLFLPDILLSSMSNMVLYA